jgi:hypothetical protein
MKFLSVYTYEPTAQQAPQDPDMPARMYALISEMRAAGVLLDTGGRGGEMREMKISRKNGATSVTDGPFTESKEVVGGYALFEVKDRDELVKWTDRFLSLLGTGTCYIHEVVPAPE